MEEKELNLCELLKGCEGEKIFLVDDGECIITEVADDEITFEHAVENKTIVFTKENISLQPTGFAYAYPFKESFLTHPLDAYSAWMEWKAQRELEFNKPECYITDVNKWWELKAVAKFRSSKEAKQAAEAVRECLEKFQKDHAEQ